MIPRGAGEVGSGPHANASEGGCSFSESVFRIPRNKSMVIKGLHAAVTEIADCFEVWPCFKDSISGATLYLVHILFRGDDIWGKTSRERNFV